MLKIPTYTFAGRLRRELGALESYAGLVGVLIGAGIFRVTSEAWVLTGSSVILGYVVLAPVLLATSVAYMAFLSSPLGEHPGGEYTNMAVTFGSTRLASVSAWLKIISYIGAAAFLATALADYVMDLADMSGDGARKLIAVVALAVFWVIHMTGVRWFGRVQVVLTGILVASLLVLIVPGLAAIDSDNYRPVFVAGASEFATALPPLFFAFAGFEAIAHTAGEVRNSRRSLPGVFARGIVATTAIYVFMSVVTFGVLPGETLAHTTTPMADVAAVYLPAGAAVVVSLGAIMAMATSLNVSLLVPSRLGLMLAEDGALPRAVASVHAATGIPVLGLTANFVAAVALVLSGQTPLALNVAVFALVLMYFLHSLTLLLLPMCNPELDAQIRSPASGRRRTFAALVSMVGMAGILAVQIVNDVGRIVDTTIAQRWETHSVTAVELATAWGGLGLALYGLGRLRAQRRD